jgi:hypothetical protein
MHDINKGHPTLAAHLLIPKGESPQIHVMHKNFAFPPKKGGTNQSLNLSKVYMIIFYS